MIAELSLHHVGCAVRDLEASLRNYGRVLGGRRRSPVFDVTTQAVRVCFVELGSNVYLELIEGRGPASPIENYTRAGFYHLCFLVDNLAVAIGGLDRGFLPLPAFASEAFDGKLCQFVVTPESHLIELAEIRPSTFAEFFTATATALT